MLTGMHERGFSISPKWRNQSPGDVVWAVFGDEFVAYHRPSGKTHFLNAASHLLICDILHEPRNFADIADAFALSETVKHPEGYFEEMKSLLNRLEALGLIERV
jgi:PqqD family protein of HPr-rel-A system